MVKHNNVIPNGHFKKHWQNYVKRWFNQPARKERRRVVDHRRKNRSLEGLQTNVQRLKTFKAKLVVFPRRARKFKAGDSAPEELASATQVQGPYLPIAREKPSVELVKVTEEMKSFQAYDKLRLERTNQRHVGCQAEESRGG
uniref:60S ribosomal protein L13 n=1 Tax=Fagus sylvatica TaxID=28930 RepID=A0A2N9GRD3_FAGSY